MMAEFIIAEFIIAEFLIAETSKKNIKGTRIGGETVATVR